LDLDIFCLTNTKQDSCKKKKLLLTKDTTIPLKQIEYNKTAK